MNRLLFLILSGLLLAACRSTPLENTARTLNRDLDLVKSPYQYAVDEEANRLKFVLRKMPVGETAADATLRADVERAITQKLNAPPRITEIRIFETHPHLRREVWVVEHDGKKLAFDVVLMASVRGADFTVQGPAEIEGAL